MVEESEMEGIPTDYDQLEVSEWGLDQGDIGLIHDKLKLTPTERLMAAQAFINTAIRIRAQNDDRASFSVPEEGVQPCLVIEVISPRYRDIDE